MHEQVLDQIMVANLMDDGQSWILAPDGTYRRIRAGTVHRPSLFHDQPEASGCGSALKLRRAVPRLVLRS